MTLSPQEYVCLLRQDLTSFIHRSFRELNPATPFALNWHIEKIAEKLEGCRRGDIKRLAISLPPRNAKSICASIAFPAWLLGHHPNKHIICASYGQDLANKLAEDSRRVMKSAWYEAIFGKRLSSRQAVDDFKTIQQGSRMATSVGGVLTGRGADFLIIDDPLKPDQALSETERTSVNNWYDNTLVSRLDDKGAGVIIIIMQRLHQDDLIGHVLNQGGWNVLSFPAIAEATEAITIDGLFGRRSTTRQEGEPLHVARENLDTLNQLRATMGEYNFSAQYQQNPIPLGGAMVKTTWLRYYEANELPSRFGQIVMSWDTANKATELSDYSVCTIWGSHNRRFYLLDVYRARLNYPSLKRKVIELAGFHDQPQILIEDKASGTQLIQDLQDERLYGVTPYTPIPGTDKIMRLHAQSAKFENGQVYLPKNAPWLADYVKELTSFPGGRYDDQVDSTTQALDYMRMPSNLEIWEKLAG